MRSAAVALFCGLVSCSAFAVDGHLDPGFGTGGKVTVDMGADDWTSAMVVAPDGRIYLAGSVENPSTSGVIRLLPDGTPDHSYGIGGKVTLDLDSWPISDAALQPNGKLVFSTRDICGNCAVRQQVCRVAADGSGLDASFGDPATPGCRVLQQNNDLLIHALAVQPDGKIVLAGERSNRGWIARLDAHGKLDLQFNGSGEIFLPQNPIVSNLRRIAVAPDGKIVAVGRVGAAVDFEVFRLGADGQPDLGFGNFGRRTIAFDLGLGNSDFANAVQVLADGSILVAGTAQMQSGYRPALVKLRELDGAPVEAFGSGGKRSYNPCAFVLGACEFGVHDVVVQTDRKIILGGWRQFGDYDSRDFFAMRVHPDGTPDTSFGVQAGVPQGAAYVPFNLFQGKSADSASRAAMHQGHFLLAGIAHTDGSGSRDFAIARLHNDLIFTDDYER